MTAPEISACKSGSWDSIFVQKISQQQCQVKGLCRRILPITGYAMETP